MQITRALDSRKAAGRMPPEEANTAGLLGLGVVEGAIECDRLLAMQKVAGSIPVTRSNSLPRKKKLRFLVAPGCASSAVGGFFVF